MILSMNLISPVAAVKPRLIVSVAFPIVLTAVALTFAIKLASAEESYQLPAISIPAPVPRAGDAKHCADVKSGDSPSLNCLNEKLRQKVDQVNPVINFPPVDAKSQDLKVGTVNIPAVQQQYGKNFGNSVIPYRPPPPVFLSPLVHR
ncbi:MAG: hypothetical protein WDN50_06425 [Bradyrhizobium sp.]